MMRQKTVSVKQIQQLDRITIETYGLPGIALMENAGRAVTRTIMDLVKKKAAPKVVVVCGLGNNGGDGFVVARHLINAGSALSMYIVGDAKRLKGDAYTNYTILRKLHYIIKEVKSVDGSFKKALFGADVIVDALFGVGLNREIQGLNRDVVGAINDSSAKVVSVDIPSGLDGTDGNIYGVCIQADRTVTFGCAKKGFTKRMGPKVVGTVIVDDIGFPKKLINAI